MLVEPIRKLEDIEAIKEYLLTPRRGLTKQTKWSHRDYGLFTIGINTGLRPSDLLSLRIGQLRYLNPTDDFVVREKKTGKTRRLTSNDNIYLAVQMILEDLNIKYGDYRKLGTYINDLIFILPFK